MRPTYIGLIVLYILSQYDVYSIQNLRESLDATVNPVKEGDILPAIVVADWGGDVVNLKVFLDGDAPDLWVTSVPKGDQPMNWKLKE